MAFSPAQLSQLKGFVKALQANPCLLDDPNLSFFRDYLVSLGASLPKHTHHHHHQHTKEEHKKSEAHGDGDLPDLEEEIKRAPVEELEPELEPEHEPEPDEPEEEIIEPVDPSVIPPESDSPQQMGDLSASVSDEAREKAQELRSQASEHIASGELDQAIGVLTEAITNHNGSSAPLYSSRGQCYLRMKKPASAIRDADLAIKINPDSAAPYRVRGRAKALLGQWNEAVSDLKAANLRDYDPEINETLKAVSVKADEVNARQKKRDEQKKRRESKQSKRGATGAGAEGPNFAKSFNETMMHDPEVLTLLTDPELKPILAELMKDPSAIGKYKDNPKVMKLYSYMSKFGEMFGPNS